MEEKEMLRAKFLALKEGNHSAITAALIGEQLVAGIGTGVISWDELGISEDELRGMIKKYVPAAHRPVVSNFRQLWQEYDSATENGQAQAAKRILAQIKPVYDQVRTLMNQHVITPQALMPCKFFELQEALREVSG
jgi:hypothetical protein